MPWHKVESKREIRKKLREQRRIEKKKQNQLYYDKLYNEYQNNTKSYKNISKGISINSNNLNKKKQVTYPPTIKKAQYRIDVLALIYLDDLVKGSTVTFKNKIPDKSMSGLGFYEGVMIAADSLKRKGYNLDIYIHDISSKRECVDSLLKYRKLDSSDLVIGAVLPQDILTLSNFCNKKHINFVSALSPADGGVKANKLYTIVQPTLKTHCEWIINKIEKKYSKKKVTILYRNSLQPEENAYNYLMADSDYIINRQELLCNKLPTKKELNELFDTSNTQIIVATILDLQYTDSLLKLLNHTFPKKKFEIYGMPTWIGLGLERKSKQYQNLSFIITEPFNFDATNEASKYVNKKFDEMFGGTVNDFVYRGFETTLWFGNLIRKYGTVFNSKYSDVSGAPFTKYEVYPRWDKSGKFMYNENIHIYSKRYEDGKVEKY